MLMGEGHTSTERLDVSLCTSHAIQISCEDLCHRFASMKQALEDVNGHPI